MNSIFGYVLISSVYLLCSGTPLPEETDAIEQVKYGRNAILSCKSNTDNEHLFMFWELANGKHGLVGADTEYDRAKYNFEVLSGNLTIRAVTLEESGIYKCVSRGVSKNAHYQVRSVRMVVEKDWEDVWEHDSSINYFRVVIIVCSVCVLSALGYFIYTMIKRRDYHRAMFLADSEDDDDDSAEVFRAPGTSKGNTGNIILDSATYDENSINTDFKKVLNKSRSDDI